MTRQTTQKLITALYPRLSHEDTLQGESNSISNQENICQGGFHPKDEIPYKLEFLSLNSINVAGFILFRYNICLIFGLKVEDFLHLQRVQCFR